jgi:hypothetical protein
MPALAFYPYTPVNSTLPNPASHAHNTTTLQAAASAPTPVTDPYDPTPPISMLSIIGIVMGSLFGLVVLVVLVCIAKVAFLLLRERVMEKLREKREAQTHQNQGPSGEDV